MALVIKHKDACSPVCFFLITISLVKMKATTIFAAGILMSGPLALAGDLCLSSACTLAPPGQGAACGWYQMWSPGVDVCGPGTQEISTGEAEDLEEYLTNTGGVILDDICGESVILQWNDGRPELYILDVEGGMSWTIGADNVQDTDQATDCNYSGTDCGNAGPIFKRWFWPDLPIC
ncbi:hypothetical protein BJY04DRAFT_191608 [Aspergillus karnatakaensis]|uniref:uncharacterized protein n=1 Tax=Aspergillus karnatakaensis TaxID=1810916 RepID=UPI003CCD7E5A